MLRIVPTQHRISDISTLLDVRVYDVALCVWSFRVIRVSMDCTCHCLFAIAQNKPIELPKMANKVNRVQGTLNFTDAQGVGTEIVGVFKSQLCYDGMIGS